MIVADQVKANTPPGVESIALQSTEGKLAPADILKALFDRGLKRILIEGGADTVSRFMQAGCLDRLHVIVAPIIMGSGRPGFSLPAIEHMDQAVRIKMPYNNSLGKHRFNPCIKTNARLLKVFWIFITAIQSVFNPTK